MRIHALRLHNVRRFAGRGVAIEGFGDGVNVLCAANEFGKSTSFEALHALFFQPYSGTPGEVQRLRPYSGGSPLVEVDIETAAGRFRIAKQYYAGKNARVSDLGTGRILHQADEAENFISGLVKGGTGGPAGLLWVRQGVTGLERRSKSEEDGERQTRATLLESVQGEVEAVTGGRRMAEIMARVADELDRLVTKRGPKAGGRYAAAIEEQKALAAREAKLSAEVAQLREALDKRALAARRLAELDREDDRLSRRAAIERAEAAFDLARAHAERLKAAEAELRLARERSESARRTLEAFQGARIKAGDLRAKLGETESRRLEATRRRDEAAAVLEAARRNGEAAEAAQAEARNGLARLDAATRARDAAARFAGLRDRMRQAETTRQALEACEAGLEPLRISPRAIDDLQALEIEIARLEAVAEAARPSVSIAYEANGDIRATLDGAPLTEGETRSYGSQASLHVAGVGTITLRSNRAAAGDEQLTKCRERRRAALAALAVPDLASARARQAEAERAGREAEGLRARLALLAPEGLAKLRAEVAAHTPTGDAAPEPDGDPAALRALLVEADTRRQHAREAAREAEPMRQRAEEAILEAHTALAALNADKVHMEAILGREDEREDRRAALEAERRTLDEAFEDASRRAGDLRAAAADLASLEATVRRARSVAESAEKEIQKLELQLSELGAEIRARSEDAVEEAWRETAEALSAADAQVAAFEREVAVLQTLGGALERARAEARELYLKPVMAELKPLLGLLFDDASIVFDDRTLLPQTIRRNGLDEEVERLSGGMREQLSVLTRLAFARLLARDGQPAPVILDDALVYSDDDRIERMFDALHRQSRDQQIIVFSCRQRAFQKLGGHALEMRDWQP
ncbi:AAA family ATPase [Aureimonas sp. ME7]|uniref:AAA family ATPase n=1 Tax=Aureimonas sp. ME7 TaxID=2744252 RepID=UPI0015F3EE0C|nr:AAA family ATPase [Aureimonas sp. ME7]